MSTDNQNEVLHASNDVATDRFETPVSNWPASKHPGVPECLHHFLDHEFKQLAVYADGRTPLLLTEEQYNTLRGVLGGLLPVAFELTGGETTAELWAVHAQGPDDIFPAFDLAAANQQAAEFNALSTPSISVGAIVIPSPLAPLAHWQAVAEQEREHKLHLLACVVPSDANLSTMRKDGLSIDGDNAYKRDLLDCVVGALAAGKQRGTPPPAGHWLWRFYEIGQAEADERDAACAAQPAPVVPEGLSSVLDEYERQTKQLPCQHEIPERGCSTYNWRMSVIRDLRALLAAAPAQGQQAEFGDAYQGAREDLAIWKRRALEAEEKLRTYDQRILDLGVLAMQSAPQQTEQKPVHWRAVLRADQQPQQLHDKHVVGFTTKESAEAWVAEKKDFHGWDYVIEPLYAAPTPSPGYMAGAPLLSTAAQDVLAERNRQITAEGWTPAHDDEHACDEIAAFACFYAMPPAARDWDASSTGYGQTIGEAIKPEGWQGKTGDRRRELIKAGALILAEVERLDRTAAKQAEQEQQP